MRRKLPPPSPPLVMSYSQMFQRPVHAGWPSSVCDVLDVGQRIANTSFLPSYDTSGSDASPLPCVKRAVRLCSGALADDFSRMKRSPPSPAGAPLVGFMLIVLGRITYAIGTSPFTVTVLAESLPLLQAASHAAMAKTPKAVTPISRRRVNFPSWRVWS